MSEHASKMDSWNQSARTRLDIRYTILEYRCWGPLPHEHRAKERDRERDRGRERKTSLWNFLHKHPSIIAFLGDYSADTEPDFAEMSSARDQGRWNA